MRKLLVAIMLVGLGASGCKGKVDNKAGSDKAGGDKAGGDKAGGDKKGPVAVAPKNLGDKMGGLQLDLPADAKIDDTSADAPNVMISSEACTIMVSTVTLAYADSFDKAVTEVEKDPGNKFKAWMKKEQSAGGWELMWTAGRLTDETKTLYGSQRRITVGDKQYDCSRNSDSVEQADCVAKACATLKKAP